MKRNQPEHALQRAIAQMCEALFRPGEVVWSSIDHAQSGGGKQFKTRQAMLLGRGVQRGVPDMFFCWSNGDLVYNDIAVGWIELKSPQGRVTEDQRVFMANVQNLGHYAAVVRSIEDFERTIAEWGIPTRRSKRWPNAKTYPRSN